MACFYKRALGPTLWAWFLSKQGMPYKLLARAQLALKCQRTLVLMFQVCCPGGVIALSISADWFLMWSGLFLIFFFCTHQIPIFLCPWLLLAACVLLCMYSGLPGLGSMIPHCSQQHPQALPILWLYPLSYTLNLAPDFPAPASSQLWILSVLGTQFGG